MTYTSWNNKEMQQLPRDQTALPFSLLVGRLTTTRPPEQDSVAKRRRLHPQAHWRLQEGRVSGGRWRRSGGSLIREECRQWEMVRSPWILHGREDDKAAAASRDQHPFRKLLRWKTNIITTTAVNTYYSEKQIVYRIDSKLLRHKERKRATTSVI
jgi:hypothetical protein